MSGETSLPVDDRTHKAIQKLGNLGLSSDLIAQALSLPKTQVLVVLKSRIQSPEEKELADAARLLAHEAIKKAMRWLQFGHPDQQFKIMRSVLPSAVRMLGESGTQQQEVKVQLDSLFSQIRDVPPVETIVTETEIIDVESTATPETTQDQDQGPRNTVFGY